MSSNDSQQPPKLLLTAREAADALSISERTLWTWTKAGLIRAVHFGRAVRYAIVDLQAFIAKQGPQSV